jgi:hypothetical protein
MSDKLKLLETANKKASMDKDFVAYYLNRYLEIEQVTQQQVINALNCPLEDYYKLGLCKAPAVESKDFLQRLTDISIYSHISAIELNKIIKRVNSIEKISNIDTETKPAYLMAARDKNKKE